MIPEDIMRLRDFMIADQFYRLLDGLGTKAMGFYLAIERKLERVAAPGVSWGMQTVETGILSGLTGKRHDFLLIEYERSEYRVLVNARTFGSALQISWFLIASPRLTNELLRATRPTGDNESRFEIGSELTTFQMMNLNAFVSLTRLALGSAVAEITEADDDRVGEDNERPEFE